MKLMIVIMLIGIFISLGSALYFLLHERSSQKMVKALTFRISLSLALFVLIIIAYLMGWIHPHRF